MYSLECILVVGVDRYYVVEYPPKCLSLKPRMIPINPKSLLDVERRPVIHYPIIIISVVAYELSVLIPNF